MLMGFSYHGYSGFGQKKSFVQVMDVHVFQYVPVNRQRWMLNECTILNVNVLHVVMYFASDQLNNMFVIN